MFAGTWALVRLALRRDRVRAPLWVLGIAGTAGASGSAVAGIYRDQAAIDGYASLAETSAVTVAFAGPAVGLHTLAGIVVYETSLTAVLGVSIMAVMMMSRHSRAEEESGRSEVLRSTEVGRHAGGAAALIATSVVSVVLGLFLWLVLAPTPLSSAQAGLFGAGTAMLGIVYAAATLVLAQLFVHARTVTGSGLLVVGIGYVLRAAGDVREDWLVWTSPIGWVQATYVPTEARWWPLLLPLLAVPVLLAATVVLAERRDFGAGLVPTRSGPAEASRSLSGPFGLGWRMQRTAVLAWSVGVFTLSALIGSLGESMQDMIDDNPMLADYLEMTEGVSITDSYLATMLLIQGLVVAGFAVWSAGHPGADEGSGQLELVLSGPVGRTRSLLAALAVTVLATTLVMASSALGIGLTHGAVMGDAGEGWEAFLAQLVYLPAILVLVGVVVLVDGWTPRWTGVAWALLAFYFVMGWLGGVLRPPQWLADLSAFEHTPRVPVESAAGVELPMLLVIGVALAAIGAVGRRRRDIGAG